jgi:hypothetical protein
MGSTPWHHSQKVVVRSLSGCTEQTAAIAAAEV